MRICDRCGEVVRSGFTSDEGDCYICETCFEEYMDDVYGAHHWMEVTDDGCGGFYLWSDDCGYVGGTGIYWTEWEDEIGE